jgi:hypothetical protein
MQGAGPQQVFATTCAGYAISMTDDSQAPETKPGPPNPQAEGVEAASPPGGPLRQDGAAGASSSAEPSEVHDDGASANPAANKDAEAAGGHTIPIEDEQPDPQFQSESGAAQDGDTLEFENAETSLDQPSEG